MMSSKPSSRYCISYDLSTPLIDVDTSESVINKLRQENDNLRRELNTEKERNNGLVEVRVPKTSR